MDIGPGDWIWICALRAEGDSVAVSVGASVGGMEVSVGVKVALGCTGTALGVLASEVAIAAWPVSATTVGKYSSGKGVGDPLAPGMAQPVANPNSNEARRIEGRLLVFMLSGAP